jgi:D-aminoacyl-tRNA deacylase
VKSSDASAGINYTGVRPPANNWDRRRVTPLSSLRRVLPMFGPAPFLSCGDPAASCHAHFSSLRCFLFCRGSLTSTKSRLYFPNSFFYLLLFNFITYQRHLQCRCIFSSNPSSHDFSLAHYIITLAYLCQDIGANMRLVIQRVDEAAVKVDGEVTGQIGRGLLVLVGITKTDTEKDADYLLDKLTGLRIFPDEAGKMNRNIVDAGGSILIVSQFTLYGDCRKGRRPSFDLAAPSEQAKALYDYFIAAARLTPVPVETGVFQASMQVHLVNNGPVTIILESAS